MTELLSSLATIVTQVMAWVGTVGTTIVSTPLLLIPSGFFVLGASIKIFKKLL